MRILKEGKTLKQQLFLYFLLISVFACVGFGVYYFNSERRALEENLRNETNQAMHYAAEQIERTALRVEEFANQICQNAQLLELLTRDSTEVDGQTLEVVEALDEQFRFVTITEDILSLLLVGENGLDLRRGREAALTDDAAVKAELCAPGYYPGAALTKWGVSRTNYCRFSQYPSVLPFSRRIVDIGSGETLGHLVLLLRESVFVDACNAFLEHEGSAFCVIDRQGREVIRNEGWIQLSEMLPDKTDGHAFPKECTLNGVHYLFFEHSADAYPWKLVSAVPAYQFTQQLRALRSAAVGTTGLVLVLSLLLATLFSSQLARPIQRMVETVEDIAQGNFARGLEKDSVYELRRLENSIEKMQGDLKGLMDSRVAQEKEKRTAEMQMLRAQINPHFLYNTLNSIKMMAVMQGAHGIQNMTEALGSLLRASLSRAEDRVTLREELALLEQYIYIQNIRYKGNIEYQAVVKEPSLMGFRMQRFLLQPLLENAIMHGIEQENAERRGGRITLTVWREADSVFLAVEDDGAGIPEEKLERLARGERLSTHSIGIYNVDRRLRMTYGQDYGLRFESVQGAFTRVTVRLRITEEDGCHEETPHNDC